MRTLRNILTFVRAIIPTSSFACPSVLLQMCCYVNIYGRHVGDRRHLQM